MRTRRPNVRQRIWYQHPTYLWCTPSSWKPYKVLYSNIVCFYCLSFTLTLLSSLVENVFCLSQSFGLNVCKMFTDIQASTNVSTILIKFKFKFFFFFFFAFALDNNFFAFLELGNELIQKQPFTDVLQNRCS